MKDSLESLKGPLKFSLFISVRAMECMVKYFAKVLWLGGEISGSNVICQLRGVV